MKKLLSLIAVLGFAFAFTTNVRAASYEDLVGWWKLDGEGKSYFDGIDDYYEISDNDDLHITTDITIEAKINIESLPDTYSGVVTKGTSYMMHLDKLNAGTYRVCPVFYLGGTYGAWQTGCSDPLNFQEDYYVAVTYDGSVEKVFVNGVLENQESRTGSIDINTTDIHIGHDNRFSNGTRHIEGYIYDVKIWSKALTEEEFDYDMDGVPNTDDKCEWTDGDSPTDGLGTNRWRLEYKDGSWVWTTELPNGKGPKDSYTIDQTHGCSCDQILAVLEEKTGEEFEGHHKFGCSKSILEDWIAGEYHIENVEVPSNTLEGKNSNNILLEGKDYLFKAYGQYTYNSAGDWADAEWFLRGGEIVTEGSTEYVLDLGINDYTINRDWGSYNEDHEYELPFTGLGNTVNFAIYDSYNDDNVGSLFVGIYAKLW